MKELTALRTPHSKTYDAGNGKLILECSLDKKHYLTDGAYQPISTAWENEPLFGEKIKEADHHLRYFDQTIRFGFAKGVYVDYTLPCALTFEGDTGTGEIDKNTTLRYIARPSGVKMEIVLASSTSVKTYSYATKLVGCTAELKNNALIFANGSGVVGSIPAPWMVDANGELGSVALDYECGNIILTPDEAWLASAAYPVVIDPTTTLQVGANADDGFAYGTGSDFNNTASVGYIGNYNSLYAHPIRGFCRFTSVDVPKDAPILSAKIQFKSRSTRSEATCSGVLYFNAADDATAPTTAATLNGKALTTAYAEWDSIAEWVVGTWYDSPDIKSVVQEIVNRANWNSGNAMMLMTFDNGSTVDARRHYYAYDSGSDAAKLVIEYTGAQNATVAPPVATASAEALAPAVTAGTGATVAPPAATASAEALAPEVTVSTDATVEPPVATASAEALAATIWISIIGFKYPGKYPAKYCPAGAIIEPPAATASAEALAPAVTAGTGATVAPPAATASAEALAPAVSADEIIESPAAMGIYEAPMPAVNASSTIPASKTSVEVGRLVHANSSREQTRFVDCYDFFDCSLSLSSQYKDNSFVLSMPIDEWKVNPIAFGEWVFIPGTEYGGRVQRIRNVAGETVEVEGYGVRGWMTKWAIYPDFDFTTFFLTGCDANEAILALAPENLAEEYFNVSSGPSGITIPNTEILGYSVVYDAISDTLLDSGARLEIAYDDEAVAQISAAPIADLSRDYDFSQDYGAKLTTDRDKSSGYNYVVGLGAYDIFTTMRSDVVYVFWKNGSTHIEGAEGAPDPPEGLARRTYIYDSANGGTTDTSSMSEADIENMHRQLIADSRQKLREIRDKASMSIDLTGIDIELNLGDIVGARDYVTGLVFKDSIYTKILRIEGGKTTLNYTMKGDVA